MYQELAERLMRSVNFILLTFSIVLNFIFLVVISWIYMDIQSKMVFDIDKIRKQYVQDAAYFYMQGCTRGATDYPEDRKEAFAQGEFGASPVQWCGEMRKEYNIDESAINTLIYLGKDVRTKY